MVGKVHTFVVEVDVEQCREAGTRVEEGVNSTRRR